LATFGVVYVAFGAPYLAMAINSLLSLRITNPGIPVCIVTNVVRRAPKKPWWRPEIGDQWIFLKAATKQNRHEKTSIYKHSAFDLTLYLDCDTMVLADLSPIPNYLHYFDLLLSPSYRPAKKERRILDGKLRYPEDGYFNTGVFAFRRGKVVEEFFSLWNERYHALGYVQDQPALMEAYSLGSVRMFPLLGKWNTGDRWNDSSHARQEIIIWHYKMRLEPLVEDTVMKAVGWFAGSEKHLQDTERFLDRRRRERRSRSLQWKFRRFVTRIRGDQSRRLEKHSAKDQWLRWLREE
jgi:hypothetical protein